MNEITETAESTVVKTQPGYGFQAPETSSGPRWGARAIYSQNRVSEKPRKKKGRPSKAELKARRAFVIDLVWDRMEMVGGTEEERKAMGTWLDNVGLDLLGAACDKQYITTDCEQVVEIERDGYHIKASPRASYGYIYIGCWRV